MTSKKEKPEDVNEYIISFPKETQKKLREILESLRKAAPGAEENLKWGVPALSYDWILFTFAAYKNHISLYPHPRTIKAFEKDLINYDTSSSTIRFPLNKPLPLTLIRKIADFRVKEAEEGVKWM